MEPIKIVRSDLPVGDGKDTKHDFGSRNHALGGIAMDNGAVGHTQPSGHGIERHFTVLDPFVECHADIIVENRNIRQAIACPSQL